LGAVRTVLFAWKFGAEGPPNAFFQASRIPDLVYFLIAGGALRSGFVPVFTKYWAEGRREQAWRTFSALFWFLLLLGGSIVAVGIAFAPQLAVLIGPGWAKEHAELLPLCAKLMRLMFPAQLFFVLGGLLMGTLNARQHFLWPGMGPIVYNLFVVGAILAARGKEDLVMVAAILPLGALVGNVLLQVAPLKRLGGRLQLLFDLRDEGLKRTLALAAPVVFGLAIAELEFLIMSVLATLADPRSGPSTLVYANLLWRTPTRVFGGGISIALFPSLAYHFAEGASDKFRRDFSFAVRTAIFMAAPVTVGLLLLAEPTVGLLYQRGQFTAEDVGQVAETLLAFSLGILPLTIYYLVARAFYARHDTRTPVLVGLLGLAVCVAAGWLLMGPLGVPGLALAIALATAVNTVVLWAILARRVGALGTAELLAMVLRLLVPLGALAAACWGAAALTPALGYGTIVQRLLTLLIGLVGGGGLYVGLASVMGFEELQRAIAVLRRRGGGPTGSFQQPSDAGTE
ncbi:MAG: murein biosynthesis integral membrane protein MurJ, partial [Armatimonadetes bacterium]|nr:murein biosynthesis integral membrane protein MurJ [Armatimonadota bacterium]